jgi:hypothetical protein
MEAKNANGNAKRLKSVYMFLVSFGIATGLTSLLKEPGVFSDSQVYMIGLVGRR